MLVKGLCGAAAAALCFAVGLNDAVDPFRLFHGLSQVVVVVVVEVVVGVVVVVVGVVGRMGRDDDDMPTPCWGGFCLCG